MLNVNFIIFCLNIYIHLNDYKTYNITDKVRDYSMLLRDQTYCLISILKKQYHLLLFILLL